MIAFRFKNVCIESIGLNLAPIEVSSAEIEDRLAPVLKKFGIPFGTLERLSGIKTRYQWPANVLPSMAAVPAAQKALEESGVPHDQIGALFSCSVTRDYFEPATACVVHSKLGLPESAMVLDVSNACLGFTNGMMLLGNMIEAGVIKAGVLVSGETINRAVASAERHLLASADSLTRAQLIELLATFTIGSGAVAMVLTHSSISKTKHQVLGGVARSATNLYELCRGNDDYVLGQAEDFMPVMHTESSKLITSASKLGARTWAELSQVLNWKSEDVDHIFCHQVGRQVNEAFYKEMGLDISKEFTIYQRFGNLASAAVPTALALGLKERNVKKGDKVVLSAFGSGLNSIFVGLQW